MQGLPEAQGCLGAMYANRVGIPPNEIHEADKKAFYWYKRAVEEKNPQIQHQLALLYAKKVGLPSEEIPFADEYAYQLNKSASEQGYAPAQNNLALVYKNKRGILKKEMSQYKEKTYFWLKKAAAGGDSTGQANLAQLLADSSAFFGEKAPVVNSKKIKREITSDDFFALGVEKELLASEIVNFVNKHEAYKEAFNYYSQAASLGNTFALYKMGNMYSEGLGVERSKQKGQYYLTEYSKKVPSVDQKNKEYLKEQLGFSNNDLENANKLSFKMCEKAAIKGLPSAQCLLGTFYEECKGTNCSENEGKKLAFYWYKKAASSQKAGKEYDPSKSIYHGVFYNKLLRRLQFQYLREEVAPERELDQSLFSNEDYVLDKCTQEEFVRHKLLAHSLEDKHKDVEKDKLPDWDTIRGQAYIKAKETIEKDYYDQDSGLFTIKGAKTLLKGMRYLEEE